MDLDVALVSFPTQNGAVKAFSARPEDAPWRHEVAFVEVHHNGRVIVQGTFAGHYLDVDETDHSSQPGAAEGALTGALVGALVGFVFPGAAFGFVVGGAVGLEAGTPTEQDPEPGPLIDTLRSAVPLGGSAVVLVAAPDHVDAMVAALAGSGTVSRHRLSAEESAALEAAVQASPAASSGPTTAGEAAGSG